MATKSPFAAGLLDELQASLVHGNVSRRVEMLRRVTDLFIDHAQDYSSSQIAVFDDVFICLIDVMEAAAKINLSERLAPIASAPPRAIRSLAFDDLIDVASPVLSQSEQLDDNALIENARTKSQAHLLAISERKTLTGAVTDILIERGNDFVVQNTVNNLGAVFSERGYDKLIRRADGNDAIATCVGLRPSIPRHHYLKLVAKASATVRARLEAAYPRSTNDVVQAVRLAAERARSAPGAVSDVTRISHELVRLLHQDGRLDENEVLKFALNGKFDEVNASIACLAHMPVSAAETMMTEASNEGIMILAKVVNFSWATVKAIINLRERLAGEPLSDNAADRETYERLRPSTAQQVLRFHRMQHATAQSAAG